jgi:uncharacterized protein YkwD
MPLGSAGPFLISFCLVLGSPDRAISIQHMVTFTTRAAAQFTSESLPETRAAAQSDAEEPFSEIAMNIHQQVNEFRRAQRLKPLTLNRIISAQARAQRRHGPKRRHRESSRI